MDVDAVRRAKNTLSVSGAMEIGLFSSDIFAVKPYNWAPMYDKMPRTTRLTIPFEGIYVESRENGGHNLLCLLGNATSPAPGSSQEIVLVLQYPKTFSLTNRGINGEMISLNQRWNRAHFGKIQTSSQPGHYHLNYQFGSHEILSKFYNPYPYPEPLIRENINTYRGDGYCEKMRQLMWGEDLLCEPGTDLNRESFVLVSGVLRVIQKSDHYLYREEKRTCLSTMTLSMEGKWHSFDGQLCRVGCIGPPDGLSEKCNARITLYIPLSFSIKQRSAVFGTITSTTGLQSHAPLMFQKLGDDTASLSFLANDPSVKLCAVPLTLKDNEGSQVHVEIELLSIGPILRRHDISYQEMIEYEKRSSGDHKEIKVSGYLRIRGGPFHDGTLNLEGMYDPAVGIMYLVGCKDVSESSHSKLETGLDYLIEIKVEYYPKNA
ncbi:OLC1v1037199C1 [Oldenlandia corymbosa var. corymbosa]|uniref:OLC1v1037199C1 n=1 Tax=Oldenlandia corymbosa var. corymbosa TaxID=529605 RepID=A0AAV1CY14_OLDCO|nr:OLC1v1037199C1 [Oldenlandia corymbosa var. corymbosa]